MTRVAAEELIRPLAYQSHLDVLSCPLTDEVHRDDRGRCDRLLEHGDDPRQRLLEGRTIDSNRHVAGVEDARRPRGIDELVVVIRLLAVTDRIRRPDLAAEPHHAAQETGSHAAA